MGPIGAPDGTVRSRRDYRLRDFVHRLHSTFLGQTIWCRHFEPAIPVLHQGEQPLEIGFGQAVFLQHVSHMVRTHTLPCKEMQTAFDRSDGLLDWEALTRDRKSVV